MTYSAKKLDESGLEKVQALEKRLNCCIVALDQPNKVAEISKADLEQIKSLEKDLDAVLVAYQCKK